MDDLLSEKEQIEAMRHWWQENGRYVVGGIVLGVAILVGWNQWRSYQLSNGLEASALYETLVEDVSRGDLDASETAADALYESYASTSYAALARLAMARLYMEKGRDQDAADTLRQLLETRGNSELLMIGRLRLARIYLYQDKPQELIDLLSGFEGTAFAASYDELLGDAHAALGQITAAIAAYERAMSADSRVATVNRSLIQMKMADLPEEALADDATTDEQPSGEKQPDEIVEPEAGTTVEPEVGTADDTSPEPADEQ